MSHVERFRLRHAIASIEVVRDGKSCLVHQEELTGADFDSMVCDGIEATQRTHVQMLHPKGVFLALECVLGILCTLCSFKKPAESQ